MRDDSLRLLIADMVEQHRPQHQPPFEALAARWRRCRTIRRTATAAAVAVVAATAIAVPAALLDRSGGHDPQTAAVSPATSRPTGPIPWDVTGVTTCGGTGGTECHTITDPGQVELLVGALNASAPYSASSHPCGPVDVTATFAGPRAPYPVVGVTDCGWWTVRGSAQRYTLSTVALESLQQAQRLGVVVHDCGVTGPYLDPKYSGSDFVGLTLDEARSLAERRGIDVRIFGQDGKCTEGPRTDDHRGFRRVNLYLERGRVKTASFF